MKCFAERICIYLPRTHFTQCGGYTFCWSGMHSYGIWYAQLLSFPQEGGTATITFKIQKKRARTSKFLIMEEQCFQMYLQFQTGKIY